MSVEKYQFRLGLEIGRFVLFLVIGLMLFLFLTLVLDVVGYVAFGGWNPHLGAWPVFGSTISVAVFGSKLPLVVLILSYGILCRMIVGPVTPGILRWLDREQKTLSSE
jgi:hypothetical protein